MIWLTVSLFFISSIAAAFLRPGIPGHVAWYMKLNWQSLFDVRFWWAFLNLWDVRIAFGLAYWVATW